MQASPRSAGPTVIVRYFAAARAAAGVAEERVPAGGTLAELTTALVERHGPRLGKVLSRSSFLVDGVACRDPARTLPEKVAIVDVLPPFAGG